MKDFLPFLKDFSEDDFKTFANSALAKNIDYKDLYSILTSNFVSLREYEENLIIFSTGQIISKIALLLSGKVYIRQTDYWGNNNILNEISKGNIFGEAFVFSDKLPFINEAAAIADSKILFLDFEKLLHSSIKASATVQILQNLLTISSARNRHLAEKLSYVTKRTTREKLLSYLSACAEKKGSPSFTIPFNRQQLADYLAIDRSAMSAELSRMKKADLIEFKKSEFVLKEN